MLPRRTTALACALLLGAALASACSSDGSARDAAPSTARDGALDAAAFRDDVASSPDDAAAPLDAAAPMDAAPMDAAAGPAGFGEPCSGTTCAAGLQCVKAASGQPGGFCTQECNVIDAPCPAVPAGATCNLANENATASLCAWQCNGPGDACPPGLVCRPTGGPFFCQ